MRWVATFFVFGWALGSSYRAYNASIQEERYRAAYSHSREALESLQRSIGRPIDAAYICKKRRK